MKITQKFLILFATLSTIVVRAQTGAPVINTIAGSESSGTGGITGADPLQTGLLQPRGLAIHESGSLYISEGGGNIIRQLSLSETPTIKVFVGGPSLLPDGPLTEPRGIAVDRGGNVYVAEFAGQRVRKVNTGSSLTVAGSAGDPSAVVLDPTGTLYFADWESGRVQRVTFGTDTVVTTIAGDDGSLLHPSGLALDGQGNLYIADTGHNLVRKVNLTGAPVLTTVVGDGQAAFNGDNGDPLRASLQRPTALAVDSYGRLYIADTGNQRIRRVQFGESPSINTVVGNGTAAFSGDGGSPDQASLREPEGLAIDAADNLYIADTGNQRVRLVTGLSSPAAFSLSVDSAAVEFGDPVIVQLRGTAMTLVELAAVDEPSVTPMLVTTNRIGTAGAGFLLPAGIHRITVRLRDDGVGANGSTARAAAPVTVAVGLARQRIIFPPLPPRTFGEPPTPLGAFSTEGLAISYRADGNCSADGMILTLTGAGSCTVTATQAGTDNVAPAESVSQTFPIQRGNANISLLNLSTVYDGKPHAIEVATDPRGLSTEITYEGAPEPPVNVGSYLVTVRITDPNYQGRVVGTLVIAP